METLEYETLVRDFEEALLTQLRGHSAGSEYLRLWVPDNDPVKSILNMAEAALLAGHGSIRLRVQDTTLDAASVERLRAELVGIGQLETTKELAAWLLVIYY
jgi:hypothetical protein